MCAYTNYHVKNYVPNFQQIKNSSVLTQHNPAAHSDVVAKYSNASTAEVNKAIDSLSLFFSPGWTNTLTRRSERAEYPNHDEQ